MRFLNFLKRHLKASIAIGVIAVATTIGVLVVNAAQLNLNFDTSAVNFTPGQAYASVTASCLIDAGNYAPEYHWTVANPSVASTSTGTKTAVVQPIGAGRTSLKLLFVYGEDSATKEIPVTVPLIIDHQAADGILSTSSDPNYSVNITTNLAVGNTLMWQSSNSSVVEVVGYATSQAKIFPRSGGTATITATVIDSDGTMTDITDSFTVTVGVQFSYHAGDIGYDADTDILTVKQGETSLLHVNSNSPSTVKYWSEDPDVVTIDEYGNITGVYAGTTVVYASCVPGSIEGGAGDSLQVNVPYVVGNNGQGPDGTILVGDQITLPTTAKPNEVDYRSSNNNVIYYDAVLGKFVAMMPGEAEISVSWRGETATFPITVIDSFILSNTQLSINIGATQTLSAIVSNTSSPVIWTVSDPDMISISPSLDGLSVEVTALSRGQSQNGRTSIVATQEIGGVVKSAVCEVYILNPVEGLILMYNGNEITEVISLQKTKEIFVTAYMNFGGAAPDNTKLSWVSSDSSVLKVEPYTTEGQQQLCRVTGLKGGNATITVVSEDGLYIATADFYVTEGIQSISLDKDSVTANMALQRFQLTATILPNTDGVDMSVTWSTLDPNIVKVDQNGLVTFVSPGETYVSVTSNADTSKVAYCKFLITQQVDSIKMDYDKVTMNVGEEYRLTAVLIPSNATNQNIIWTTSNDKIVKVDASGMLTAVGSGTATIIAQSEDGGHIDMTNVTVLQPVTEIKLSETEMSVKKGTVFWLNATVLPETANNKKVTWSSSDTSLATVDQTGKVTTLKVGTVTIACVSEDNGSVAYCIVDITEPVTGLTLNTYYQEMVAKTKFVLIPTVLPIDAPDKRVTFVSSDPSVAVVDENGVVTALTGGTCEIIVTTVESSLKANCTINVREFVESIEITDAPELLNVDSEAKLGVTVKTDTASNKNVIWSSSNQALATVDQSGRVKGVGVGNVVITATAADGSGVSDSVVIRVINPVTQIVLNKSKETIFVGDTINIKATINPENASIKEIKWTSDNEAVAKVYSDGDVTGVTPGRTIIRATSTDGNEIVATCTIIVKDIIKASSISVNAKEITMLKGKTRQLTARIYPTNTHEGVNWVSSDTSVVKVDKYGNIVTVGAGTAEITAYSSLGTVSASCTVHSIAMHFTSVKIEQYDPFYLYVDGAPSKVSWRTSNPRIATVTSNGQVVGRMPGECVITATVDGKTLSCYVKVLAVDPGKFINTRE